MTQELPKLSRLQRVDLRQVWSHEAHIFTPWLAMPENLTLLAESLGFENLDLIQTEQSVEEFSADIVARVPDTGEIVLIENQLERSDHSHLGQLLAYAAGTKASAMVWIAPSFAAGHRAALEWLNDKTPSEIAFFAVGVEAWKIGDSPPAPRFNVLVKPNEWVRSVQRGLEGATSANKEDAEYWAAFQSYLIEHNLPRRTNSAPIRGTNYYLYLQDGNWCWVSAYISRASKRVGAYVALSAANAPIDVANLFQELQTRKAEIESEIGPAVFREVKPNQLYHVGVVKLLDGDPANHGDWARQHQWLGEKVSKLHRFVGQLIDAWIKSQAPL
jgi:Domain of unknown function (DUF4268)